MSEVDRFPQPNEGLNGLVETKPLTMEELSAIRTEIKIGGRIIKSYAAPEGTITTTFLSPDFDKLPDSKKEDILLFLRSRQNGESYRYEALIVNSLLKQIEIGQKLGLSRESLYRNLKLNVENKGTTLVDDWGYLYLQTLDDHIAILRQQGVTDDQLITELAGHIFHESLHNSEGNIREVLLNGKSPFGEISTVTAQMAFYLEERYKGPTAYDSRRFKAGLNKIRNGGTSSRDYDIATYVGGKLIYQALIDEYPALLSETENMDPISACQTIVANLSPEERQKLINVLKKAISKSSDEKIFEDLLDQTRKKESDQPVDIDTAGLNDPTVAK